MSINNFNNYEDNPNEKTEELREKLKKTEEQLIKLNSTLEQRVIERTVEVNRLLKDKIRFIDNLSHDLGTPLTPIITLLPIIKSEITDVEIKEMIDTCLRNAEYIKRVVNNARELAELGSTDLLLKKENLLEIITEMNNKYEDIYRSCNIDVENRIGSEVFIKTERNRLMQIFDHISSNAVNSMLDKGGKLIFESKPFNKDGEPYVQVSITDTGTGLTRDQIDHVFNEFYKTDDSRHKLDSTGLGLTICKTIIEKHGGKIWADSHGKGTGTTIYFTVPSDKVVYTRSFI
ncbi:MAG: HAMP domain-containing histidine kinase [Thermoplasmatales archaeon]|nr:MAG: HAMP domain-containing histidine kinase [Thermoplasmatales archaeon]